MIAFVLAGAPRTKNTGRAFVRNGRMCVIPPKQYAAWLKSAQAQAPVVHRAFRDAGLAMPLRGSVQVSAVFYRDRAVGDLDRYLIGVGDYLQRSGVIVNDKQIVSWDGSRLDKDAKRPRVEVTIGEVTT